MGNITEAAALSVVESIGSIVGRVITAVSGRPIVIVRWILVVPAAVFGFYVAMFLSMWMFRIDHWGHEGLFWLALIVGVLGAPMLVVLFGAAMAPSHRAKVAWSVYSAGLVVAARMSWWMPDFLISAATAGACAAGLVQWSRK